MNKAAVSDADFPGSIVCECSCVSVCVSVVVWVCVCVSVCECVWEKEWERESVCMYVYRKLSFSVLMCERVERCAHVPMAKCGSS